MEKEQYEKLFDRLQEDFEWPMVYYFKFIVPNKEAQKKEFKSIFNGDVSDWKERESKNGNYISFSVKELMLSPENVINRYKEVSKINGVISL